MSQCSRSGCCPCPGVHVTDVGCGTGPRCDAGARTGRDLVTPVPGPPGPCSPPALTACLSLPLPPTPPLLSVGHPLLPDLLPPQLRGSLFSSLPSCYRPRARTGTPPFAGRVTWLGSQTVHLLLPAGHRRLASPLGGGGRACSVSGSVCALLAGLPCSRISAVPSPDPRRALSLSPVLAQILHLPSCLGARPSLSVRLWSHWAARARLALVGACVPGPGGPRRPWAAWGTTGSMVCGNDLRPRMTDVSPQ